MSGRYLLSMEAMCAFTQNIRTRRIGVCKPD